MIIMKRLNIRTAASMLNKNHNRLLLPRQKPVFQGLYHTTMNVCQKNRHHVHIEASRSAYLKTRTVYMHQA